VATYPLYTNNIPTTVVLTAPAGAGAFGGWSYNCVPSDKNGVPLVNPVITAAGPNYCSITFSPGSTVVPGNTNVTVGAIFN
jgi:hypothetical protein